MTCLLALFIGKAHAAPPSNNTTNKDLSNQVRAAIVAKDVLRAQEIARHMTESLANAKTGGNVERLAKGVADLLRFLLDSGDAVAAKLLAETTLTARAAHGRRGDALDADLINAVGEATFEAGDLKAASDAFKRSLKLREKVLGQRHALVGESLNNLAVVQQNLGDFKSARTKFERSLRIRELTLPRDHKDIAESVNNLAVLYLVTGEYAKAELRLKRALEMRERISGKDSLDAAQSANNLAELYREIGDVERALPLNERALAIRQHILGKDHQQVAESLNNLALVHSRRNEPERAEASYREALRIYIKVVGEKHAAVASIRNNLGLLLLRQGKFAESEEMLLAALAVRRGVLGDEHPRTARSLDNLAKLYLAKGNLSLAEPLLSEALVIVERSSDPDSTWRVLDTTRRLEELRGSTAAAIVFAKRAVNILQSLRVKLATLEKSLQQSFLKDKGDAYRALFALLVADGRLAEAQQVLVMLKEDEYFDFIRRDATVDPRVTKIELTTTEEASLGNYKSTALEISKLAGELKGLRGKKDRNESDNARMAELVASVNASRRRFDAALGEIHQYFASASTKQQRAQEIGEMNLGKLRALQGTLQELGDGVVTLHYVLLDTKVKILLTTSLAQVARDTDISAPELSRRIQFLREAIQDPRRNPLVHAKELHRILIAPVAAELKQAGANTLMLSLDGPLRYVPFAALHDGQQFLIEQYRIALFTEAARDKLKAYGIAPPERGTAAICPRCASSDSECISAFGSTPCKALYRCRSCLE